MKFYIITITLIIGFIIVSKAQHLSPLDTIPKDKKMQLLKFGENNSIELLAEKTLRLFRNAADGSQKYTNVGFYKIPDLSSDSTNIKILNIPIDVINSLNKREFSEYLLVQCADSLNIKELIKLNKLFKTKDGTKLIEFTRKIVNDEPIETDYTTTGFFSDIEAYDGFFLMQKKLNFIYDNMMSLLYGYIEKKTKAHLSSSN